jgi:nucleotide-binding universal stress UspA family protein
MLKHILVGVNGSDEAIDAIALAHYLAKRTGADVTALSAYPLEGVPPAARPRALHQESEFLFRLVREAFSDDVSLSTEAVCESSPARALTHAAEETGADLVVVGSTHRAVLGRVFPGSVGERLLHGAPCPVAVSPRRYAGRRHMGVGLIGVGHVDTLDGRMALTEASGLAAELDAAVRVIGVFDLAGRGPGFPAFHRLAQGEFEEQLVAAAARLPKRIEREAVALEGNPAALLAEQGLELDLLVVGSRGYGALGRTLLGGVSAEVMRTAPCPVIVVPRHARRTPEPVRKGDTKTPAESPAHS